MTPDHPIQGRDFKSYPPMIIKINDVRASNDNSMYLIHYLPGIIVTLRLCAQRALFSQSHSMHAISIMHNMRAINL